MSVTASEKLVKLGQLEDAMEAVKDYVDENAGSSASGANVYYSASKPANMTANDLWVKIL